ncbi:hypothetical protein FGB62_14g049 [Gracilaria domingensis]|nr:hypothetical protein FGB62_14g049 [Gracilaria domingensis]
MNLEVRSFLRSFCDLKLASYRVRPASEASKHSERNKGRREEPEATHDRSGAWGRVDGRDFGHVATGDSPGEVHLYSL